MKKLIAKLAETYPEITFTQADTFYWNPRKQTVCYDLKDTSAAAEWSLLHELSHGLLGHSDYRTDFELLLMETSAWEKASELQQRFTPKSQPIDEDHIQDCLDTYRDWLHSRSICPTCDQVGLEEQSGQYLCVNCLESWRVSSQRFTRPYRLCSNTKAKTSPASTAKQMKFY